MRIACLHTVESNVAVFEQAARAAGLPVEALTHTVRPDLLAEAERQGGLTDAVRGETAAALRGLFDGADAVLLTCSTVGPGAEDVARDAPLPVLRVDGALADAAVRGGGRVVSLCAVDTTVEPTRALFERAASRTGATVTVQVVPGAWAAHKAGNPGEYARLVARAAEQAVGDGADMVALAQASMAGAAALVAPGTPVLTSPQVGLEAARAAAG